MVCPICSKEPCACEKGAVMKLVPDGEMTILGPLIEEMEPNAGVKGVHVRSRQSFTWVDDKKKEIIVGSIYRFEWG